MIIETFGLPAAGKSTYVQSLSTKFKVRHIVIRNKVEKHFYFWIFRLLNPRLSEFLAGRCLEQTRGNPALLAHKWELYQKVVGREQKARFFRGGVIDEGLINFLLTLYEQDIPESDLAIYRELVSASDRQVHILETSAQARQERLATRENISRRRYGEDYYAQWSSIVLRNYGEVRRWVLNNYDCKLIAN